MSWERKGIVAGTAEASVAEDFRREGDLSVKMVIKRKGSMIRVSMRKG